MSESVDGLEQCVSRLRLRNEVLIQDLIKMGNYLDRAMEALRRWLEVSGEFEAPASEDVGRKINKMRIAADKITRRLIDDNQAWLAARSLEGAGDE